MTFNIFCNRNISIRNRILAGLFVSVGLVLGAAALSILEVGRVARYGKETGGTNVAIINGLGRVKSESLQARIHLDDVLRRGANGPIDKMWSNLDAAEMYLQAMREGRPGPATGLPMRLTGSDLPKKINDALDKMQSLRLSAEGCVALSAEGMGAAGSQEQEMNSLGQAIYLEAERLRANHPEVAEALSDIKFDLTHSHLLLEEMLAGQPDVSFRDLLQQARQAQADAETLRRDLGSAVTVRLEYDIEQFIRAMIRREQTFSRRTRALADMRQDLDTVTSEYLRILEDALVLVQQEVSSNLARIERTSQNSAWVLSALTVLALLLSFIIGGNLALSIARPVWRLQAVMEKVAVGDLSEHITSEARDEIGVMSESFGRVIDSLSEVSAICETVADGDFTVQPRPRGEHDVMGQAIHRMVENFRKVVSQARAIALGDYSIKVMPRSMNDQLGLALHDMTQTLSDVARVAELVSKGDYEVPIVPMSQKDQVNAALHNMTDRLKAMTAEHQRQLWKSETRSEMGRTLRGVAQVDEIAQRVCDFLCQRLDAEVAGFYLLEDEGYLKLRGAYGLGGEDSIPNSLSLDEGLVGQAIKEGRVFIIEDVPEDYLVISSALGRSRCRHLILAPVMFENAPRGIIEMGAFHSFSREKRAILAELCETIGIVINQAESYRRIQDLLEKSERQSEELQAQQMELQAANEELESQTMTLMHSQESLRTQQEELQAANEELEVKSMTLQDKTRDLERQNAELEQARQEIEQKARDLASAGKYKSEFLANMSHELRTPLNSLLILARKLSENKGGNLTEHQTESARIIYESGADLLNLLNDILDLSKIEAGRMEIVVEESELDVMAQAMEVNFRHLAESRSLAFNVIVEEGLPETILTDQRRVGQILKNLLSNAFKFTSQGHVELRIRRCRPEDQSHVCQTTGGKAVALSVSDTGVGIAENKLQAIFEAFQQADGSISRQFGGTGLGLSISRELAALLQGEIQVQSQVGKGSAFTLYLPEVLVTADAVPEERPQPRSPIQAVAQMTMPAVAPVRGPETVPAFPDDRNSLSQKDPIILVIEDDPRFAKILYDFCRERYFQCVVSHEGVLGFDLAIKYRPAAIILDRNLPDIPGLKVLNMLKECPAPRHIPVHIMSVEDRPDNAFDLGAIGYLTKPVQEEDLDRTFIQIKGMIDKRVKDLLVVEDDPVLRASIVELIGNGDVKASSVGTGAEALEALRTGAYDCVVLDLRLPDMTGFELLKAMEKDDQIAAPPVIVYTGKELSREEEQALRKYAESIIVKGVSSEERLLDETALFLHRTVQNLPENKQEMLARLHDRDHIFKGKRILLVDDDMRNVFALSGILQEREIVVFKAENGEKALKALAEHADIDMVLMDIMMPVMNGYDAIVAIRQQERFKHLPILALTAKAMRGDRAKCIEAGANDYLTKPVEVDRLLSIMRVWLQK